MEANIRVIKSEAYVTRILTLRTRAELAVEMQKHLKLREECKAITAKCREIRLPVRSG